jgi:hypothetical protein
MTAAHCVEFDRVFVTKHKKKVLQQIKDAKKRILFEIARLSGDPACLSNPLCSFQLSILKISLTNINNQAKELKKIQADVFIVRNSKGQDTSIRAVAEVKSYVCDGTLCRDYAIIVGNFKDFEKLPIKPTFDITPGESLRSCGYAGGKVPPVCTDFTAVGPINFLYSGRGYFLRGMSGGPVIDSNGYAVGIISRVHDKLVLMDTMIGILDFIPKPKEKQ